MSNLITAFQEECLTAMAVEEQDYQDLLFFYAAERRMDQIEALSSALDPTNEMDLLVFELFQGTGPQVLMPLINAETSPWIRYSVMKAFLNLGATEQAFAFWKQILDWQVPDTLVANTLLQFALREGHFKEAGDIAAISLSLAPRQRDVAQWNTMAISGRSLDCDLYLDPLPQQRDVCFAVTTRGAAAYIEQTLIAITTQNYPIAELIAVEETLGLLNGDTALQCAPRRFDPGVESWITVAARACTTPLIATIPPDCAPAFDYLQNFILAAENGPRNLAAAGARLEAYYQEQPSDCWRDARMKPQHDLQRSTDTRMLTCLALCLDSNVARALSDTETGDIHALSGALDDAGHETHYIPEAVSLCLREDTLDSALKAYWLSELAQRERRGDFASLSNLIRGFGASRLRMTDFMNRSIEEENPAFIFPDFFHFFHASALDLRHGVEYELLDEGRARAIQDRLIETIAPLDENYKRDLRGKVRASLGARVFLAAPTHHLPAESDVELLRIVRDLTAQLQNLPQALYHALVG